MRDSAFALPYGWRSQHGARNLHFYEGWLDVGFNARAFTNYLSPAALGWRTIHGSEGNATVRDASAGVPPPVLSRAAAGAERQCRGHMGRLCKPCDEEIDLPGVGTVVCNCVTSSIGKHKDSPWCVNGGGETNQHRHLLLFVKMYLHKLREIGEVDEHAILPILAWIYWLPAVKKVVHHTVVKPGTYYTKLVAAAEARGLPKEPLQGVKDQYTVFMINCMNNGNGSGTPPPLKNEVRSLVLRLYARTIYTHAPSRRALSRLVARVPRARRRRSSTSSASWGASSKRTSS